MPATAVPGTAPHTQSPQTTSPADRMRLYRRFLSYYRSQWHLFAIDSLAAVVMTAVDLAFPVILRNLTGGLFTEGSAAIMAALGTIALGLVVMYAVRYACRYFVAYWGHVMGARMESRMRQDLFDQYERFSFSYFDRHNTGDLMSRVVSDLFDICEAAHHGPEYAIICGLKIVGSFAILAAINWKLSLALALITAVLWAYNARANRRMQDVFMENRLRIAGINSRLEDSLGGMRVVKSFANEDVEREKFAASNEAYLESKARMYHAMGSYQATIAALMGLLFTVVVVYGGWLVAAGEMNPVDLATYALYITTFTAAIEQLLNFTEVFQKAQAGFRRLDEILSTSPDVQDAPDAPELRVSEGHVTYRGVRFSYDGEHDVIRGLDLDIRPGETIALVGPSGGGKSTTCALLPRFYDVREGSVVIDGQDVRTVTQKSLREAIGIVQQDVYLFDGTVGENIAYGRPSATFEEIRQAARLANIADFVEALPDGYETRVGERGARLSGGQKQRIAIARVFLKDPKILVLDEATSALDNESEHAVQESLARLAHGRTTLVIAHRLSTIKDADEIVTIADGRAVERGTHEQLLAANGTYASYYRMQFGDGLA